MAQLVRQANRINPAELRLMVNHIKRVPFATDLLQADAPLWGSFWQFDVIAPGYRLPADELAWLRATRLDNYWPPDSSMEHYLTDLREAVQNPQAAIWTLVAAEVPCVVFAAINAPTEHPLATVVWYCAATDKLHAGYKTPVDNTLVFNGAVRQSPLQAKPVKNNTPPSWVKAAVEQRAMINDEGTLAEQLDAEILRRRLNLPKLYGASW